MFRSTAESASNDGVRKIAYSSDHQVSLCRYAAQYKKKARSETKNYRPVSLLSMASKVMEKIINTSIMNFLERENLLSAYQFGFRSGLGAADLLTALNREWLTSINTGGAVRVLAVDIAIWQGVPCRCPSQTVIVWCRGQSPQVAHRLPFQKNATGRCWRCYFPTLPSCCWGAPRKHPRPNPLPCLR